MLMLTQKERVPLKSGFVLADQTHRFCLTSPIFKPSDCLENQHWLSFNFLQKHTFPSAATQ